MRKVFIVVLILSGAILIGSSFLKEEIVAMLSNHFNIGKMTADKLSHNNRRKVSFNFSAVQPPSFYQVLKTAANINNKAVIGQIRVDSVGIKLPILKGTTSANLLVGATTMRTDQRMGEGNYPIAGHHMRREDLLFGPLMKVQTGASIVITDLKKNYIYQVVSKKTVPETNNNVIKQTSDRRITLVTCDKPTRTPNRLIVVGKLVRVTIHRAN